MIDQLGERARISLSLSGNLVPGQNVFRYVEAQRLTLPSESFFTFPVIPSDLACLTVKSLQVQKSASGCLQ